MVNGSGVCRLEPPNRQKLPLMFEGIEMYVPEHFEGYRTGVLHDLITQFPLGMLCTCGKGGLDVNHLPFMAESDPSPYGKLHAHVARANSIWEDMKSGDEVLVVFRDEEGCLSPNRYPTKHEFHRQVPRWKYRVAHAYGRVTIQDDERDVRGLVPRLTHTREASEPKPWKMGDSSKDYIDAMLQAIVGVEIEITRLIETTLRQNKASRDTQASVEVLKDRGNSTLTQAMPDAFDG